MNRYFTRLFPAIALAAAALFSIPAAAQEESTFEMSLDELLSMKVLSVTRTEGITMFDSPASLYVITQEDIRRSGYIQLPEILRLAPGLQVSRMDASTWAISARGFNNRYNRMQLVQMDGRTLYNNLFGGVYWEAQDCVTDDLERIEVIRGPGASLWGANAVDGIISMISKPAKDTQGWLLKGNTGSHLKGIGTVRYGGHTDDDVFYRVYAKSTEHKPFDTYAYNLNNYEFTPDKSDDMYSYTDESRQRQGGFRADWTQEKDEFTIQGDAFDLLKGDSMAFATYTVLTTIPAGAVGNPEAISMGTSPTAGVGKRRMKGWNILGRWTRNFSENSQSQVQIYYDWNSEHFMSDPLSFSDRREILDFDFQHNLNLGKNHKFIWGAAYRRNTINIYNPADTAIFNIDRSKKDTLSGFVQDSFSLLSPKLEMTVGTKLERNDVTGGEMQPSARLTWKSSERNLYWGAVSKAVRVPVVMDTNINTIVAGQIVPANSYGPGNPPIDLWMPVYARGNANVPEEEYLSYELGWRLTAADKFSLDTTYFTHRGHHTMQFENIPGVPAVLFNGIGNPRSYGLEMSANWLVNGRFRLSAGYTWYRFTDKSSVSAEITEPETPRNQAQIRAYWDASHRVELNSALYYNDTIQKSTIKTPAYFRLDAGLAWKFPETDSELRLSGQNLLDARNREFAPDASISLGAAEIERSLTAEFVKRF